MCTAWSKNKTLYFIFVNNCDGKFKFYESFLFFINSIFLLEIRVYLFDKISSLCCFTSIICIIQPIKTIRLSRSNYRRKAEICFYDLVFNFPKSHLADQIFFRSLKKYCTTTSLCRTTNYELRNANFQFPAPSLSQNGMQLFKIILLRVFRVNFTVDRLTLKYFFFLLLF